MPETFIAKRCQWGKTLMHLLITSSYFWHDFFALFFPPQSLWNHRSYNFIKRLRHICLQFLLKQIGEEFLGKMNCPQHVMNRFYTPKGNTMICIAISTTLTTQLFPIPAIQTRTHCMPAKEVECRITNFRKRLQALNFSFNIIQYPAISYLDNSNQNSGILNTR